MGDKLEDLHDPDNAQLDGEPLFDDDNPVRRLRDLQRPIRSGRLRIEMTNGDVLPGRIVEWAPGRLVVAPEEPTSAGEFGSVQIAVRQDCVRRFALGDPNPRYTPGLFATRDGRRATAHSFRWTTRGVDALTDDGVTAIDFADLTELHLPSAGNMTDLLRDGVWSQGDPDNPVVRIVTQHGAALTYSAAMAQMARIDRYRRSRTPEMDCLAIRPAWSLETVYLNPEAVVSISYRNPGEIPLSALPAEVVEQRYVLHRWPWRRNANVRGGRLQSGPHSADLGIGMYSGAAIAFSLPEGATEFSTWVGLDSSVGRGGCVICRIHRDSLDGPNVWDSDFLRGGEAPIRVGPLDVAEATRLVLVVDRAHESRPAGADPWDMRDEVVWIEPTVTIDRERLPQPESEPERWIPQLDGWEIADARRRKVAIRPFWDEWRKQWAFTMRADDLNRDFPLELTRRMQVELANAVLPVAAASDNRGRTRHAIYVKVNGDDVDTSNNRVIHTKASRKNEPVSREWSLGEFQGQQVQLSVVVEPLSKSSRDPMGLLWESLAPIPLVQNLPLDGRPLMFDTPLTSLIPLSAKARGKPIRLQPGKLTDGQPLAIRGWRFTEGFGVPTQSEITYRLQPEWRRFVAIIGLAGGWQGAGPYSILLDGKPHWECQEPLSFGRSSPALQIDVPLPAGHENITLRAQGEDSIAAWACAGFVK